MAFEPKEVSRAQGDPIALYFFRWGADTLSFNAYTDAEHAVTSEGELNGADVDYEPLPIMRKNISSSGTLDKSAIEIVIPRDAALNEHFRIYPPSTVVACTIRQGHYGETSGEYPVVWIGRVVGFSFQQSQAVLALEPFSTSLRRSGLRRTYQYTCPYVLFDGGTCRADKAVATSIVTISGASGNQILMPGAWFGSLSVNKYLSGTVEWINADGNIEIRMILQILSGQHLLLDGPTTGLTGGDSIDVILGCNRQDGVIQAGGDCFGLHKTVGTGDPNINNFGGYPWIPKMNPVNSNGVF